MSETQRPTLAEFLLARIEEDEEQARIALSGDIDRMVSVLTKSGDRIFLGVTHPNRVLAECEAKRGILGQVFDLDRGDGYTEATRDAVIQLAAVHAAHPDYDPGWRPAGLESTRPTHPGG